MKRHTFRVGAIALCLAALAAPAASGAAGAQRRAAGKTRVTVQPVRSFSDGALLPGGGSALVRSRDGVFMSYHAAGLAPGEAVTAWFAIFNEPRECATSPCTVADLMNPDVQSSLVNATGRLVGPDGTADFGAYLDVGDTSGAFTGPGLLDAFKAEIHFVVRSHGPALLGDPQALAEQFSVFNGGCPPNTCANIRVSIHQP